MSGIKQPMPGSNFSVSYVCQYESEIDRGLILDSMGHYIEEVLGTHDIIFVKLPMEAVNKLFCVDSTYVGEEIEFDVDYRHNNVKQKTTLVDDELPPLYAVMTRSGSDVKLITTIEPCKFIIRTSDIEELREIMRSVELAPKEYNITALDKVHWNEKTKALKQDFEFFTMSRPWFISKEFPWNRAYMLHGPPGNGKTTTVKAFARYLNVTPELFDFTAQHQSPDKAFTAWMLGESERIARDESDSDMLAARKYTDEDEKDDDGGPAPLRLLILEDIDRFYPKDEPPQTTVSLSCVLNSLDGIIERRNTIIIATANNPKDLDEQVLSRPGRFDKRVLYEHPSRQHASTYLHELFKSEDVSDATIEITVGKLQGQSYAFHKGIFMSAGAYAFARSSKLINDDDVKNALEDMLSSMPTSVMKSEKKKFGF